MVPDSLKSLRKLKGITQTAFARKLKVTQQAVASWESGRTEPSKKSLVKIADYFNVSVDYLLGRTDKPNVLRWE